MSTVVYEPFKLRPISDFFEELQFEFPKCPDQLFQYYLLKTARDMAVSYPILRRTVCIDLQPCVETYLLEAPDGMEIVSVLRCMFSTFCDGRLLARKVMNEQRHCCFCHGDFTVSYDDADRTIRAIGVPCQPCKLEVGVSVAPEPDTCELPDIYFRRYFDVLLTGTRSSIMLILNRPWTNLKVGVALQAAYNDALKSLSVDQFTHQLRGGIKMNFGRWAV